MEPASTSIAIKAGTMVATGMMVADAVIFADGSYIYLAFIGALVSGFGVAHHIFGVNHSEYSIGETIVEIIKGVALGLLAIPFWFLLLTSLGGGALTTYVGVTPEPSTFSSLSLLIAFGMSWFTVPIMDFVAKVLPAKILNLLTKDSK